MSLVVGRFFDNGPSFRQSQQCPLYGCVSTTPEELPSLHVPIRLGSVSSHRLRTSPEAYSWAFPHGGSSRVEPSCGRSGTFTGQCCQPFCPGDPTSHVDGPASETSCRSLRGTINPQGFRLQGALAHHLRRNVTPPELSPPGPFDTARYLTTLAAYPGMAEFE